MSSDRHCCVPGCTESGDCILHHFPNPEKDRDRFNTWLYAIYVIFGGTILQLQIEHIYKNRRVCRAHFEQKYLCRNKGLSNIAVPTLNMPDLLSTTKNVLCEAEPTSHTQEKVQPLTTSDCDNKQLANTLSMNVAFTKDVTLEKENIDCDNKQLASTLSMNVIFTKDVGYKENIDPVIEGGTNIVLHEQGNVTNISTSTTKQDSQKNIDPLALSKVVLSEAQPTTQIQKEVKRLMASDVEIKRNTKKCIKVSKLSQYEKELYDKIVALRIKVSKYKNKFKKQSTEVKAAKKWVKNPEFIKTIENCSSTAKLLMQIQWRENKKKEKGRRFTLQEKIVALSLLKQSPKGYRFFRKIFILPAPQTLIKLVQQSNLRPGINQNVFTQLKKKAETIKKEDKLCILLFDEISLKPNVTFHERKDKVTGFVDNGLQRKLEFADHAQVFMIRGLLKNYKQPVSYSFSASATKGPELAVQLKRVITELQKSGMIVVAMVCDQGTNNRQALKLLLDETRGIYLRRGETPKEKVMLMNNQEIIPLYDPPHLLKGMRNNLITKKLKYTQGGKTKTAKWAHIEQLQNENPGYKGIRLIPKLTDCHVKADKINKMKVKFASQIFSRTVASNMGYLADKGILEKESQETADLLLFVDNLFDSVNGSFIKKYHAKPLLGPATPNSAHHKTWKESIAVLKTMKFLNAAGKEESVPTINNWVWTLEAIDVLLTKLKNDFNVTSVWMRHLNQDPIENFFGSIRSHGCRNTNPTCDQFESAFATLLINSLNSVHTSRGKNCEGDFCDALHALLINEDCEATSTDITRHNFDNILNIELTPLSQKEEEPRIIGPLQYVSGYFVHKAKTKIFKDCADCKTKLMSNDTIEYINYREYAGKRWLCTPSYNFINLISNMQDIINAILKEDLEKNNLKEIIKTAITILVDINFVDCKEHKQKLINYLIHVVVRFSIYTYCKIINKILTGKREIDDDQDIIQVKAKKFYSKCFKIKKNNN